jgi:glycosyltransferase involved in cell wall biosynthesis
MRIAIVAHNIIRGDGAGRINYEIVRHALREGHRVTMIADAAAAELRDEGAQWIRVRPALREPNLLKCWRFYRTADAILRRRRDTWDVIVGNGPVITEPHDVSLCQYVHAAWGRSPVHVSRIVGGLYGFYQRQYTIWNSAWEQRTYKSVRYVVAPSHKIQGDLASIGVPESKVRIIFNGVDPNEFECGKGDRGELGLWTDGPLAVFAGDIATPRKNLDSVLKALATVPGLRLAVIGALERSPFPAMAEQLGVADRVKFLGYRRDVHAIMRACDFFVFPSRYEAGALVLLEAMACGLPVISAASAGGAELVGSEAGVVLEDSEDVTALAAAMTQMRDHPALRESRAAAARKIAEKYTWDYMAKQYLSLFMECANENSRRQPHVREYFAHPAAVC